MQELEQQLEPQPEKAFVSDNGGDIYIFVEGFLKTIADLKYIWYRMKIYLRYMAVLSLTINFPWLPLASLILFTAEPPEASEPVAEAVEPGEMEAETVPVGCFIYMQFISVSNIE